MQLTQEARPALEQTLNPKLIQFYELLRQPTLELERSIATELQENPALELQSERLCPVCGNPLIDASCRECGYQQGDPLDPLRTFDGEIGGERDLNLMAQDDDDPIARLASPVSLQEHLKWNFRAIAKRSELEPGETLIDCLTDDGYLDGDLETLAEGLGIDLAVMESVLRRIQQLDPSGVGARNLRECLLIQLRTLAEQGSPNEVAARMLTNHWSLFSRHRYEEIAAKMHVTTRQVQAAADFVRNKLNPYPGRGFRPEWQWRPQTEQGMVRPDLVIQQVETRQGREFRVIVPESKSLALRVNRTYRNLWEDMKRNPRGHSAADRDHVQRYITRAKEYISNINQRRNTLKLIMEKVVEEQREFFEGGTEDLKPLTRLKIAAAIGFHESTIGRALANKHALLPSGELMPCEEFFDSSLPVKEVIRELLEREDHRRPLSDERIASALREQGIEIARRTVTKYREAMKVPAASKRRRY